MTQKCNSDLPPIFGVLIRKYDTDITYDFIKQKWKIVHKNNKLIHEVKDNIYTKRNINRTIVYEEIEEQTPTAKIASIHFNDSSYLEKDEETNNNNILLENIITTTIKKKRGRPSTKQKKFTRPPSLYNIFMKEQLPIIKNNNKSLTNQQCMEECARLWRLRNN